MNKSIKGSSNELTDIDYWASHTGKKVNNSSGFFGYQEKLRHIIREEKVSLYRDLVNFTGISKGQILEIGCGFGEVLDFLHDSAPGCALAGIDYSEKSLEATKERLDQLGIDADLILANVLTDKINIRSDIVLSAGVIEHFVDPQEIVNKHIALCKPGGFVVIVVPNISPWPFSFALKALEPEVYAAHNLKTLTLDRLKELADLGGLTNVAVGKSGRPVLFGDHKQTTLLRRLYANIAKLWNALVFTLPMPRLWASELWLVGQVPTSTTDQKTL